MDKYTIAFMAVMTAILVASVLMNRFQRLDRKELKDKLDLRETKLLALSRALEEERAKNKIKPRILREEKLHVAEVIVETTVDSFLEDVIDEELKFKLGEAVWEFAKTERLQNPMNCTVRGRAFVRVLDKRGTDNV